MAKDGNTYAKRQRETLKRQKAAEKRDRRKNRKDNPEVPQALSEAEEFPSREDMI